MQQTGWRVPSRAAPTRHPVEVSQLAGEDAGTQRARRPRRGQTRTQARPRASAEPGGPLSWPVCRTLHIVAAVLCSVLVSAAGVPGCAHARTHPTRRCRPIVSWPCCFHRVPAASPDASPGPRKRAWLRAQWQLAIVACHAGSIAAVCVSTRSWAKQDPPMLSQTSSCFGSKEPAR